jgi:DNA gyrase inhibitor GyrI
MTVDFTLKRVPAVSVATITRVGPWKSDNLRAEFRELTRWATKQGLRTGRWIFYERARNRWDACLQVRGHPRAEGRIRLRRLPAVDVAAVRFDPELVSSRIVYHGLRDWTRWRKRSGEIKAVLAVREVYPGDPWGVADAWSRCEVQFLVRR